MVALADTLEPADLVDRALPHGGIFLSAIHVPNTTLGHSLLFVCDSNGPRLLGSLPSDDHRCSKKEIQKLFPSIAWESINTAECACRDTSCGDHGVVVLVNAIYTVLRMETPQTLAVDLWRDILTLLLKSAMGQRHNLAWANALSEIEIGEGMPGSLSLNAARDWIKRLETAVEKTRAERTARIQQGHRVCEVLNGLSGLTSTKERKELEKEKARLDKYLNDTAYTTEWTGSLFTDKESLEHTRRVCTKGLQKATTCLAHGARMAKALSESIALVREAVEVLQA
jgi:hypothetical protein